MSGNVRKFAPRAAELLPVLQETAAAPCHGSGAERPGPASAPSQQGNKTLLHAPPRGPCQSDLEGKKPLPMERVYRRAVGCVRSHVRCLKQDKPEAGVLLSREWEGLPHAGRGNGGGCVGGGEKGRLRLGRALSVGVFRWLLPAFSRIRRLQRDLAVPVCTSAAFFAVTASSDAGCRNV